MFRRGTKATATAADAERQALFEELAQRPESVCPFLGLGGARADFQEQATDDHRCFAFGDPEPISSDQQRNVCLQRGYANCPRYLRGVLVIPTDELEALRHPPQRVPPPPPPPAAPVGQGGGGRRRGLAVLVVLLLLIGGGAGAWYLLAGPGAVAEGPTPTPRPEPSVAATLAPSVAASPSEPEPSLVETPSPDPTPEPGDAFIGYEVTVLAGSLEIFRVDDAGEITEQSRVFFSRFSRAPVDRVEAENGLLHWRVTEGEVSGWSYVRGESGPFLIREVYRAPDGSLRYTILPQDET